MSCSAGRSSKGTCSMFRQHRPERPAELRLGAGRERTVALAVEAFGRGDDRLLVRIVRAREFECGFDRFGSAVAEEGKFQVAGSQHRKRLGEHRAQGVRAGPGCAALALQLFHHRFDDFRIPVADVEYAESAQAVDVLFAGDVAVGIRPGVLPLHDRDAWSALVALRYSRKPGLTWLRNESTVSLVIQAASSLVIAGLAINSRTLLVYAS